MKKKLSLYNIVLSIILILILIISAMFLFINPDKRSTVTVITDQPAELARPVFYKEGELLFLDAKNNKITSIDIEIASTDAEREQGLMFRDTMAENQAMLFMMGKEEEQAFWMKNTIISLDILFVDSEKRIVSIHKNTTPYSLDQIPSGKPALYVVEVIAGYTDKYGIKEGDYISF